jgi:hypothetical protein
MHVAVNVRGGVKQMGDFREFEKRVEAFIQKGLGPGDKEELKRLLCADCQFFTPGKDEELECGCYRMMDRLICGGHITLEQLADALK